MDGQGEVAVEVDPETPASASAERSTTSRRAGGVRRVFMRPRRGMVKLHRWLAIGLMAWLVVIGLTGAWLVEHHQLDAWFHPGRYDATQGDVGVDAAVEAAAAQLPRGAEPYGLALPDNSRGVYAVWAERENEPETKGADPTYDYFVAYVDPGSGEVNAVVDEAAGFSQWLYRGHMHLWQDQGVF